jgi:hypothetical protein
MKGVGQETSQEISLEISLETETNLEIKATILGIRESIQSMEVRMFQGTNKKVRTTLSQ